MGKMKLEILELPLRLTEYEVQLKQMGSANSSFNWTVPGSTKTLYLFLQDTTAGSNAVIPPNLFRVYGTTANPAVLPTGTGVEQNLTTMQVTYAGMIRFPSRPSSMGFSTNIAAGTSSLLVQMYMQSLFESRRNGEPGPETMDQWLQRGPIYCFRFERDSTNLATEVQTQIAYTPDIGSAWPASGCNLFLVAEYYRQTLIKYKDGKIISCEAVNI